MNKRPDARAKRQTRVRGKVSRFYFKEEFDLGGEPSRFSLKWMVSIIPIGIFCTAVALAIVVAAQDAKHHILEVESPKIQAFRWAVNRAMSAAELTQTATSKEEWSTVAAWWQEAIKLMGDVPRTHPRYKLAQEKIEEYQRNLAYAKDRLDAYADVSSPSAELWSLGSRRVDILRIQGQPTAQDRYDTLCQEILHYGNSTIELSNGIAVAYEDLDKNLKVTSEKVITLPSSDGLTWTLGSGREEVFKVQGTPDRIIRYDSLGRETLYYGNSTVELSDDKVTGYSNLDNNLRVAIVAISTGDPEVAEGFWTIGSERNDVFRVQGTPTQVDLDNSMCKEVLHYGNSTVELRNGFVTGYDNLQGNLRVRVE